MEPKLNPINYSVFVFASENNTTDELARIINRIPELNLLLITIQLEKLLDHIIQIEPQLIFINDCVPEDLLKITINKVARLGIDTRFIIARKKHSLLIINDLPQIIATIYYPLNTDKVMKVLNQLPGKKSIKTIEEKDETAFLNIDSEKIVFSTRSGYIFVRPDDVVYCEADGNYTYVSLLDDKQITMARSLCHMYKDLVQNKFFRISRSIIINKKYLAEIKRKEKLCVIEFQNKTKQFHIIPKYIKSLVQSF